MAAGFQRWRENKAEETKPQGKESEDKGEKGGESFVTSGS